MQIFQGARTLFLIVLPSFQSLFLMNLLVRLAILRRRIGALGENFVQRVHIVLAGRQGKDEGTHTGAQTNGKRQGVVVECHGQFAYVAVKCTGGVEAEDAGTGSYGKALHATDPNL